MDNERNPLLAWGYYCQGKSLEELRQSLLLTTLELESTRLKAQEEVKARDEQLSNLKDLLSQAITERDEAQEKCHRLLIDKLRLQQQQLHQLQCRHQSAPLSGISSIEDDPTRRGLDSTNNAGGFSSSDCDESIVSSPVIDPIPPPQPLPAQLAVPLQPPKEDEKIIPFVSDKPLPEKGKLLQAVMKAGPLLQTLLLAGPLPQWRHPPPPIESYQIPTPPVAIPPPPVAIPPPPQLLHQDSSLNISNCNNNIIENCGRINRKRNICESCSDSPTETKYQRVVLH